LYWPGRYCLPDLPAPLLWRPLLSPGAPVWSRPAPKKRLMQLIGPWEAAARWEVRTASEARCTRTGRSGIENARRQPSVSSAVSMPW